MVVSNAIIPVKPMMTWSKDLQAGPNKRLKVDHQTMRAHIISPCEGEDNPASCTIYLMLKGFLAAKPTAIHKYGELYLSDKTVYNLAKGSEDMTYGDFLIKLYVSYNFWLFAGKPPVGCVKMPISCFVERGHYGVPGPLGYSLDQLFKEVQGQGLDEDSVKVFADQYFIHWNEHYNGDGSVVAPAPWGRSRLG